MKNSNMTRTTSPSIRALTKHKAAPGDWSALKRSPRALRLK